MAIKIRDEDTYCIVDIFDKEISDTVLAELKLILNNVSNNKRIALNLINISEINPEFLDFIADLKMRISLFNLSLNVYLLLFLGKYDKESDLYVNELDFLMNKRRIVNRKFKLCS